MPTSPHSAHAARQTLSPGHRNHGEPEDETEPGLFPIDPDQGLTPPIIPEDPEHDRMVDPEA